MTREEYINKLEMLLKKHLAKNEVDDIIRDYNEYFEDGYRQSKTDLEISAKLGNPEIIAKQFIDEFQGEKSSSDTEVEIYENIKNKTSKGLERIKNSSFTKASKNLLILHQPKESLKQGTSSSVALKQGVSSFSSRLLNFITKLFRFVWHLAKATFKLVLILFILFVAFWAILALGTVATALFASSVPILSAGLILSELSINILFVGIFGAITVISLALLFAILVFTSIKYCGKFIISFKRKPIENGGQ